MREGAVPVVAGMNPNGRRRRAPAELLEAIKTYYDLIEGLKALAASWACQNESPQTTAALQHVLTHYRKLIKSGIIRRPCLEFQTSITFAAEQDLVAIIVEVLAAIEGIKEFE